MQPERARYVIIGAGFAGAATAYQLILQGVRQLVIIEQESVAGFHSSGRNAGFIRQVLAEPSVADLAVQSAVFIRQLPGDWPSPVSYNAIGSLIVGFGQQWEALRNDADLARQRGLAVECWSPHQAREAMPILQGAVLDGAIWCASDGAIDVHALLSGYLKVAQSGGAVIHYDTRVTEVRSRNGHIQGVGTDHGFFEADVVVNAAGPWAGPVGVMAGATPITFHPRRRHLFVTPPLDWVKPDWPFVLDISNEVYFQPSSGGLMLCPCDEDELPPSDPPTRPDALEFLAERLATTYPKFPNVPISRYWAGLRTFTNDNRFVIGWDPTIKGFFWVAGLGGHGVTTSAAIGSLATRLIFGEDADSNFSPARFV